MASLLFNLSRWENFFTEPASYVDWYWSGVMVSIFIIIFMALKVVKVEKTLITSSIISWGLATSLWLAQVVPWEVPFGFLILFIVGTLWGGGD